MSAEPHEPGVAPWLVTLTLAGVMLSLGMNLGVLAKPTLWQVRRLPASCQAWPRLPMQPTTRGLGPLR